MTKDRLKSAFRTYQAKIEEALREPEICGSGPMSPRPLDEGERGAFSHSIDGNPERRYFLHLCEEGLALVDAWCIPKAMRVLGFLQGSLWARGYYTLDDLAGHLCPAKISPRAPRQRGTS